MKIVYFTFIIFLVNMYNLNAQNMAIDFDGEGDQVIVTSPLTNEIKDFTVECWFKGENGNNNSMANLFSWGNFFSGESNKFHVNTVNDKLVIKDDAANPFGFITPLDMQIDDTGKWHHIAIVKDGDLMTIYIDNVSASYTTSVFSDFTFATDLVLGQRVNESKSALDGLMDEFRLWRRALTAEEIYASRNCYLDGDESGLVLYYDFNTVTQNFSDRFIPDLEDGPKEDGFLVGFEGGEILVKADNLVDNPCKVVVCNPEFTYDRELCSFAYNFYSGENDSEASFLWMVTNDQTSITESFTEPNIQYPFDFPNYISYEICLTVIVEDKCSEQYCNRIFSPDPDDIQIPNSLENIEVTPNSETCNVELDPQLISFQDCGELDLSQSHLRSDGLAMEDPYEIGTTTVRVDIFFQDIRVEVYNYQVIVEQSVQCCDHISTMNRVSELNLGTGIDATGAKRDPGFRQVDIKWKLLNQPITLDNCLPGFDNTLNGSAYLIDFRPPTSWINLEGVTALAPLDLGEVSENICSNTEPYIFERDFCVSQTDRYNIQMIFKGDDAFFMELWSITENRALEMSPNYNWPGPEEEWVLNRTLDPGVYAIRAYLTNNGGPTGFTVKGGITPSSPDGYLVDSGACCEFSSINIQSVLDLDCSSDLSDVDIPGSEWTYDLFDSDGNLVTTGFTNANGDLIFSGLSLGSYEIQQNTEAGYRLQSPSSTRLQIEITEESSNSYTFYNCPSECFSVNSSEIVCNADLSYDVTVQIKNENDQVFDRLLTFAQTNETAVNPTISIDFGEGQGALQPGEISGDISFTIIQKEYVGEEIEVCFDVIPQNPEGGDCCKDEFCLTLPVCCEPEDSASIEIYESDSSEECCYDIEIGNTCAEEYFKGIVAGIEGDGLSITATESNNGWNFDNDAGFGLVAFYYGNGGNDIENFDLVPLYNEPVAIGTICIDGVNNGNVEEQNLLLTWVECDENNQGQFSFGESFATSCEPQSCNLISNSTIYCGPANDYYLDFTLEVSASESHTTRQVVISGHNGTTVDQYSPQSFDDLELEPGDQMDFTLELDNVESGDQFSFSVTLHDFDNELEDGTYWCCYTGEQITIEVPNCIQSLQEGHQEEELLLEETINYTIYPNPVKENLSLAFEKPTQESLTVELISITGELISVEQIPEEVDRYTLDLSDNPASIYFIRIKKDDLILDYTKILKL